MDDATLFFDFLDLIAVVETDATIFDGLQVVVIGVLVESNKGVGFVSWMKNIA